MEQVVDRRELDEMQSEAFAERVADIINGAGLALMISLGHRSRLFDVMSGLAPSSSAEIAAAAGLDERYVREWLGAMVTGRIVVFDPDRRTYALPAEHAACLTRAASPDNMAVTTQFVSLLGAVEDSILRCFRKGGGIDYDAFPRFHEVMAEESDQTVLPALVDSILPLDEGLVPRLEQGIDVLDVGCGSGRAMNHLAKAFPKSRFHGYDLSEEAVRRARAEGVSNARFEVKDVTRLGGEASFDLVTAFDAIHDQKDPASVLRGIHEALRDDGTFLMQDIKASSHVHGNLDHPVGPFLYTISTMHCMTVSLAQGGAGLGTMWGEETARAMLAAAGFVSVSVHELPHDIMNSFYVSKKR